MDFTSEQMQMFRQGLRERICSICQKFGYDEVCGIGVGGECPFDRHLARLVEAVLTTPRSDNIADYVPRIRDLVCKECPNQNESGTCKSRDHAYCGLDSFLVLVVQTIEEVYDRMQPSGGQIPRKNAA